MHRAWAALLVVGCSGGGGPEIPEITPQTLCEFREPCQLLGVVDATGAGAVGASLVELGRYEGEWAGEECAPRELWIVRENGEYQLIASGCEDAPKGGLWRWRPTSSGAEVSIGTGGAEGYGVEVLAGLEPLRIRTGVKSFGRDADGAGWDAAWDTDKGRGTYRWKSGTCRGSGSDWRTAAQGELVPQVELTPGPDWATTSLGRCAARADAAEGRGHVAVGVPGAVDDAQLAVLLVGANTLVVEVTDDLFTPGDRLTVSWSARRPWDDCTDAASVTSVAVHPVDAGTGDPAVTRHAVSAQQGRLVFELPPCPEGLACDAHRNLAVAYADDDGVPVDDTGNTVERVFGTTRFADQVPLGLGGAITLSSWRLTCAEASGSLVVVSGELPSVPEDPFVRSPNPATAATVDDDGSEP